MPRPRESSPTFSHLAALGLWIGLHLMALAAGALQAPLSEGFPRPHERAAVAEMLVVELCAGAMLFPVLFPNILTTAALVATALPLLILAGLVSSIPSSRILLAWLYVTTWVGGFACWNGVCRSARARVLVVTGMSSLMLCGPLFVYLSGDFGRGEGALNPWALGFAPLLAACAIAYATSQSTPVSFIVAGSSFVIPLTLLTLGRWRRKKLRQVIHQ